jgi:predicted nucleic acid-binding protein
VQPSGSVWNGDVQASALADTGAMLALLDRDDRWHRACVAAFGAMRLPLATTAAVLAELFHLVGDSRREVAAAWALLRSGAIALSPIDDADLPALDALMARYHDRPMDFADATLVHVARRESLTTIFTIDHDDFETYRIDGKKRFRIVPDRLPARSLSRP